MYHFILCLGLWFSMLYYLPVWGQTSLTTSSREKLDMMYFNGRIDDINDVTLTLNCEGINCNGELYYVRSRDKCSLNGIMKDNFLQLREFNQDNKLTGSLSGKVEGKVIQLEWKNKEGTIGNTIQLEQSKKKSQFPSFCGDNKWIYAYRGILKDREIEMILQRVDNNRILGRAFYKSGGERFILTGKVSNNNNLQIQFIEEKSNQSIGSLRGVFKGEQNLNTSFYSSQNTQSFITFKLVKTLSVSCLEYADYYTNYDFLFPKSESAIFNEVMILLTKDWIQECRERSLKIRNKLPNADNRAGQRAYSWSDIEFLTDNFASGLLTYQSTWSVGQKTKAFNFDFEAGENIELSSIFKKGFDYNSFIKKYINAEIIKSPLYKDNKRFRRWVDTQQFDYFTIGQAGFSFYSDYHVIYGRQRVLIPYKKLKGDIRKNSVVRQLF